MNWISSFLLFLVWSGKQITIGWKNQQLYQSQTSYLELRGFFVRCCPQSNQHFGWVHRESPALCGWRQYKPMSCASWVRFCSPASAGKIFAFNWTRVSIGIRLGHINEEKRKNPCTEKTQNYFELAYREIAWVFRTQIAKLISFLRFARVSSLSARRRCVGQAAILFRR